MKFRIDGAVAAVCAVSFLYTFGASARADSVAGKGTNFTLEFPLKDA